MSKGTVAKNATTTKNKSIKNKLQELKEESRSNEKLNSTCTLKNGLYDDFEE